MVEQSKLKSIYTKTRPIATSRIYEPNMSTSIEYNSVVKYTFAR
jgi:hypothetical protein